jgi:hypothetical protein
MGLISWLGYQTDMLVSPLPITECLDRLRGVTQSEWKIFGKSPVVGRIGERFKLRKRLSGGSYNSFQTFVSGRLIDEGASTRIACRFGMHWFVTLFTVIWLAPFVTTLIFSLAVDLATLRIQNPESYLVPVIFTAFGCGLVCLGRYMARGERQFLRDFLRDTLDARVLHADRQAAIENLWRNG